MRRIPFMLAPVAAALLPALAGAQPSLAPVVVTATRVADRPFDVPGSIDVIDPAEAGEGKLLVNVSELLGAVPGLLARDRQNFAQDVQLSVRGFGARASFGIRGVRLYVDGIPATLPDGQGQISHVDLASAARIEVLRGPFSALYGNSSGGVLQVFTEDGEGEPTLRAGAAAGSDGVRRYAAKASGAHGELGYVVSASHFETDGWRRHSAARRDLANAKLTWRQGDDSRWTLVAGRVDVPRAQDPLGLTRAQFEADPRGVDPAALAFDTRKNFDQTQLGLTHERRIDASNSLSLLLYGGTRSTRQFQAIPVGAQASPLHPGGVIDLGRHYRGLDARWTLRDPGAAWPFNVVAGVAWDELREQRRGFQNFVGPALGVQGALRRDERNRASSFDPYLQASVTPAPRWRIDAGVRHSTVRVRSSDRFVSGPNGDDSGSTRFSSTNPAAALMFKASEAVHVYAAAGRGFETPTLNELAYRPDGSAGLNLGLKPARSRNLELGAKGRFGLQEVQFALFETRTRDEIVTLRNSGGRASFGNAGRTRRSGAELSWSAWFAGNGRVQVALAQIEARYRDGFLTCTASPCAVPNVTVPAGNRIPGVADRSAWVAVSWAPPTGWRGSVEVRALGRVPVNDLNTDAAAGFATVGASVGYAGRAGRWDWSAFLRGDNLADRKYAGSVIVNEGNARFFEPAAGRTWLVGFNAALGF